MRPETLPSGYAIEAAQETHIPLLQGIETAAATIFPPGFLPEHILSDHVPLGLLLEAARAGTLPVALDADGRPVGYGLLRFVDGLALLASWTCIPRTAARAWARRSSRGSWTSPAGAALRPCI